MKERAPSTDGLVKPVHAGLTGAMAEFEQIAIDIGQLECIASDPLLGDSAEPLRQLILHLRSTMDRQFDMIAADLRAYPWWEAQRYSPAKFEAGASHPIDYPLG